MMFKITTCGNTLCKMRFNCFRFHSQPKDYWTIYSNFKECDTKECFIPILQIYPLLLMRKMMVIKGTFEQYDPFVYLTLDNEKSVSSAIRNMLQRGFIKERNHCKYVATQRGRNTYRRQKMNEMPREAWQKWKVREIEENLHKQC